MSGRTTMQTAAEIGKLIAEWEALRDDYAGRGAAGIVDFINVEIRKLRRERDTAPADADISIKPSVS